MAGKVKPISRIKQLLQLKKQEKSRKYIARTLGMSIPGKVYTHSGGMCTTHFGIDL